MALTQQPELQSLAETWSPRVVASLQEMGGQRWPPHREKQGFLKRPKLIPRFTVEGPVQQDGEVVWAVSHTLSPSAFDRRGNLTQGEREYWIIGLSTRESPHFRIEGAQMIDDIPALEDALQAALVEALAAGPKHDRFYGNRGPLSHR